FLGEADAARLMAYLAGSAETDAVRTLDVTLELRGQSAPVELSSRRCRPRAGEPTRIRTVLIDTVELRTAQRILAEVVAEQESFAHSISHDLRAPLITMTSFAGLLMDGSIPLGGDEMRDALERIRRAGVRMDGLLQNLLEYSRVSRAHVAVEAL